MPRPKGSGNKKKKITNTLIDKPKVEKRKCACCGQNNKDVQYYITTSPIYKHIGEIPICKNCIDEEFERLLQRCNYDVEKATYFLCMKLDIPFYLNVLNGAKSQVEAKGGKLNRIYLQKLNSFREVNGYGNEFLDGERIFDIKENDTEQIEYHKKWGRLPSEDIDFLEAEYKDWCTRYDVSTKSMELLVQEICYQQLIIKKKREQSQPVQHELKSLQDLMNSGALKPIQESAAMGADLNTLGTWIKKFENEKPIPDPDPEFIDVDKIKKYIRIYFLGHFCKMLGLENEYSQEYEEEMMKYKVDMPTSFTEKEQDGDEDGVE